jgi:hypothetical protein
VKAASGAALAQSARSTALTPIALLMRLPVTVFIACAIAGEACASRPPAVRMEPIGVREALQQPSGRRIAVRGEFDGTFGSPRVRIALNSSTPCGEVGNAWVFADAWDIGEMVQVRAARMRQFPQNVPGDTIIVEGTVVTQTLERVTILSGAVVRP